MTALAPSLQNRRQRYQLVGIAPQALASKRHWYAVYDQQQGIYVAKGTDADALEKEARRLNTTAAPCGTDPETREG